MKFRLVNYFDVWGNKKDGFEVNNMCEQAIIDFDDWPSKDDILKTLKKIGFLKPTCRKASIHWDNSYMEAIGIDDRNDCPVALLERYYGDDDPYYFENGHKMAF